MAPPWFLISVVRAERVLLAEVTVEAGVSEIITSKLMHVYVYIPSLSVAPLSSWISCKNTRAGLFIYVAICSAIFDRVDESGDRLFTL